MRQTNPPRLAMLLLRLCLPPKSFEAIAGDLVEEFTAIPHSDSWFWKHTMSTVFRRFQSAPNLSHGPAQLRFHFAQDLLTDLRYATRTYGKSPTLTAAILIATALSIGLNTGIFSIMNALALRPLPVNDAGNVISMYQIFRHSRDRFVHGSQSLFSWPEYARYRDENRVLSGLAAYAPVEVTFSAPGISRVVQGQLVSCNYFLVAGRVPVLGRDLSENDCKAPNAHPYVVLSQKFLQTQFGTDNNVLGRTLLLNRRPFTIIGVAPADFVGTFLVSADFWAPITEQDALIPQQKLLENANLSWLFVFGRLQPGVSLTQAHANLDLIAKAIDQSYPGRQTRLAMDIANLFSEPGMRKPVLSVGAVLMVAVGLVLLIACANVANLLLARASARGREIAVRLSVGASRFRLMRQLLTESLLLSIIGGALGSVLSFWTFNALYHWIVSGLDSDVPPLALNLSPDIRVLVFSLAIALLTGTAFGLIPALQSTRVDLNTALRQDSRRSGWSSGGWIRNILLTTQVAVCLVLLVGAGLLTRGLVAAQSRDPGFTTRNIVSASFDLQRQGYDQARAAVFYNTLIDRLRASAGVQAAGLSAVVPLRGSSIGNIGRVNGAQDELQIRYNSVSPEFFHVLDIPIVRGRGFSEFEKSVRYPVTIVSESTARRFWPGLEPLGKRIRLGTDKVESEVIGVAKDIYATNLSQIDNPFVYRPIDPARIQMSVIVRSQDPAAVSRQIREIAASQDPNVLVTTNEMRNNLKTWQSPSRILSLLAGALGLLSLTLACTGIYGIVNYAVSQRTHEIGVRMTLGENASGVLRLILLQSLRPVIAGALLGLAGAAAASRVLSVLLFGISPLDPLTFTGMAALLLLVAGLASYGPAHRAAQIDPAAALRHE